jgi:hypothetical protein
MVQNVRRIVPQLASRVIVIMSMANALTDASLVTKERGVKRVSLFYEGRVIA